MAVDKGNGDAMAKYGREIYNENMDEAIRYFKLAVDKGSIDGYRFYSLCLWEGKGVEENKQKTLEYIKKAIKKGSANAMEIYTNFIDQLGVGRETLYGYVVGLLPNSSIILESALLASFISKRTCLAWG